MTVEIILVLAILAIAVILFATEKLPVDMVALIVLVLLLVSGLFLPAPILTAGEAFLGFSNPATVTVAAMFVLSGALFRTGSVNFVGTLLAKLIKTNFYMALISIMLFIGVISAFINNTPAVAVFIPIIMGAARDANVSPSKLLMPLSFAAMLGGTCTLIGTSTNILVSSIAQSYGLEPFHMFDFAHLGLIFCAAGLIYLLFIGVRLIPNRKPDKDLKERYGMGDYLAEIKLLKNAKSVGKIIADSPLVKDLDVDIITLFREEREYPIPLSDTVLKEGDILRVRCDVKRIKDLQTRQGIVLKSDKDFQPEGFKSDEDTILLEAIIAPNSMLNGTTLKKIRFRDHFRATVLAIRHSGGVMRERLESMKLRSGDTLLIEARKGRIQQLKADQNFVFVSETGLPEYRRSKTLIVLAVIAAVITAAAMGIMPIVAGSVIGCILLVLTRCINMAEAYQSVEWKVIFLLGGVLSLGIALEKTGAAQLLADSLLILVGDYGPYVIVAAFYLITSLLTETISNNATAALMAPIAISAAQIMEISPTPLLMSVAFAASASFMTPVGYQTNALIYGPGQYKFRDFLRVGTPLNIILFIIATIMIPVLWPF